MQASRTYSHKSPAIITEEDLRYLHKFLDENFETVVYAMECVDETILSPATVDDVISFEQPAFKRIVGLKIKAASKLPAEAELEVSLKRPPSVILPTVAFQFKYSDMGWGIRVEQELIKRLKSLSPNWWYSLIASVHLGLLAIGIYAVLSTLGIILLTIAIWAGVYELTEIVDESSRSVTDTGAWILFGLVSIAVDRVKRVAFPRFSVVTGREKDAHEKRKGYRVFIFGTIIIGIIIGVAGNFATDYVKDLLSGAPSS